MKKTFKKLFTALCAAALVMNITPINASAATADNTAFFAYADVAWTYQYWGEPVDTKVVATDAVVTGAGQYTVALDFTGTADGKALGLAFAAPMIQAGEANFPGYIMQIDSIKVNGTDIEFTKNYTSCDADGKNQLRSNVYNTWVSELPEDARTADGSLDGASSIVVDPALFAEVETVSLTFTLLDADGNSAAVEEDSEVAATDESALPKTGVASFALIYGLGALATGAFALKKKEK